VKEEEAVAAIEAAIRAHPYTGRVVVVRYVPK
jgi:hypothetical protein